MKKTICAVLSALGLVVLAGIFPATAANPEDGKAVIVSLVTDWRNNGQVTDEDVSRQRLDIDRESRTVTQETYTKHGETLKESTTYEIDEAVCEAFFAYLENELKVGEWKDDNTVGVTDGSAWEWIVRYGDPQQPEKVIKGDQAPEQKDAIESHILGLAQFKEPPKVF
ncbi:MAG: hypothetical protein LBR29_11330 [Methylobacteriaceae bacterium]|nr:hypothetical protein [Methylobacteriaceae bacterium]